MLGCCWLLGSATACATVAVPAAGLLRRRRRRRRRRRQHTRRTALALCAPGAAHLTTVRPRSSPGRGEVVCVARRSERLRFVRKASATRNQLTMDPLKYKHARLVLGAPRSHRLIWSPSLSVSVNSRSAARATPAPHDHISQYGSHLLAARRGPYRVPEQS